jgi:hypothetical protein
MGIALAKSGDDEQLEKLGNIYIKSGYGFYLLSLLKKKV